MLRKFVLGTLIALIGAVGGALAVNAWEQWRADGDAPVRTVGVPTVLSAPAAPRQLDPSTGDFDNRTTTTANQERVTVPALHPRVQAQGMEKVQAVINEHTDSWMWLRPALDAAQFSFFEELPDSCASALGCYNHHTGEAWLSLDALRTEHESYSPYEGPSSSDIVLHELAHAYTRSTCNGNQLLRLSITHYAGCRSDRDGLSTDRLAEELLADTMAIAAMRTTEDPSGLSLSSLIRTPSLAELDYGYFRTGGFDGCLADSRIPDPTLLDAIYAATFDCESDHALDVYGANQGPYALAPALRQRTEHPQDLLWRRV